MNHKVISPAALQDFKAHLDGELIGPDSAEYDNTRKVWNGLIDRYPALIVRCTSVSDVIRSIQLARSQQLPIAVRSGGHSVLGHSMHEDSLVIDISPMKDIHIDPEKRTVRAGAGLTTGEFLNATQPFGLATTTGIFSLVGLSGLTLGGGIGWLAGKYGLTCDNLLAVDIVTADGRLLRASSTEYPDLFWAVRGGTGNFGVVTALEFQLHQVAQVMAGAVIHPLPRAREVLRFYRDYTQNCPDELTVHAVLSTGPNGQPVVLLNPVYCGPLSEAEKVLAPLRAFGPPIVDMIRPMTITEACAQSDAFSPAGRKYGYKAKSVQHLSDEAIETIVSYAATRTSPFSVAVLYHLHGAATRVKPSATAFALRGEHYILEMIGQWTEGEAKPHTDWAYNFSTAISPFADESIYINFASREDEAQLRATYGNNYDRLVQIKNIYDPTNLFHLNYNIKPTVS